MTFLSRTSALLLIAAIYLVSVSFAQAVDVWTVGINNTRQGWNKFETVLTPANVPNLKKIREFAVDEKIDVSPLVVGASNTLVSASPSGESIDSLEGSSPGE